MRVQSLGKSMGRGAWQATVHGVRKSQTQLSVHTHTHTHTHTQDYKSQPLIASQSHLLILLLNFLVAI